ncbi:MAG: biotin/lipoyl-binding protein [Candidatus Binatia bacterium]|nr:biotin/lipoyl-binding protein [Candidatus Binatia bacterium]
MVLAPARVVWLCAVVLLVISPSAAQRRRIEPEGCSRESCSVAARGRLEPKNRIVKVVGSSQPGNLIGVIHELYVREGDKVRQGQVLGIFDTYALRAATVERLSAQLRHAELEWRRVSRLYEKKAAAADERDDYESHLAVAKARLKEAEAALELTQIRAPFSGEVLKIHA